MPLCKRRLSRPPGGGIYDHKRDGAAGHQHAQPGDQPQLHRGGGLRIAPSTASRIRAMIPNDTRLKMSKLDCAATAAVIPPNSRQNTSATSRKALRTRALGPV